MVDLTGGGETLGKDLAMHIAASKPVAVDRDRVPADLIEKERAIAAAPRPNRASRPTSSRRWSKARGQVPGGVTLLGQPFVKGDGKETVAELLKAQGATVNGFVLYVVGEGIEKKKDDFAAEVAAMAKGPEAPATHH